MIDHIRIKKTIITEPMMYYKGLLLDGREIFYIDEIDGKSLGKLSVTVRMPVIKNIITAVIDRNDNLGSPHNPCPLVHPDPNCVPTPTNAPDTINCKFVPVTLLSNG